MALRSSLGRLHGLSKSLSSVHGARHMVSVSNNLSKDTPSKDIPTHTGQVIIYTEGLIYIKLCYRNLHGESKKAIALND